MNKSTSDPDYIIEPRTDLSVGRTPPPHGRQAMLLSALVIGALLLAIQLWFLTVALEIYLSGTNDSGLWVLAGLSGLVFVGGLLTLRTLSRRARLRW